MEEPVKKALFILAALLAAAVAFAQSPDLSKLPKGKWVDSNWAATWEIGADSIRVLDAQGAVVFDFKDKIKDFAVDAKLTGVTFSFRCDEAERSYVFTKGTADLDLTMEIKRDWTAEPYSVKLKLQM